MRLVLLGLLSLAAAQVVGGASPVAFGVGAVVSVGSDTLLPGQTTTPRLQALGVTQTLGAVTVDVIYDPAVVAVTACDGDPGGAFDLASCNVALAPNSVRFVGISAGGVSGDLVLADISFQAIGAPGDISPLDVTIQTFADTNGIPIPTTDQDGSIAVVADTDADGIADPFDNCPATANAGQLDTDAEGLGDACDPCPANPDCDADSLGATGSQTVGRCRFSGLPIYNDCVETFLGTAPLVACPATPAGRDEATDSWPPDLDDDQMVTILDVLELAPPAFNASLGDPNYSPRKDLNADTAINILDILLQTPPIFNTTCAP